VKKEMLELIQYRMKEAFETLEEAQILLKENKTRGAMNRIYYGMFYATLALLATKELGSGKHSGVITLFHKEFVKTGIFPKEVAKHLDIAFDLRTKGDYRDFVTLEKDRLEDLVKNAKYFINKVEEVIKEMQGK
jgi:uncharacterized protein (UPF0332 family)